jgi:hypothetical protein
MLRQLDLPLAAIRELLACGPVDAAERISAYWREVEPVHDGRRELADYLVKRLSGRTEPAHREAYVALPNDALPAGPSGNPGVQWQLASEALRAWADGHGMKGEDLALNPEDLGVRITYLATEPVTETSAPYCDFAVPYA